MVTNRKLAGPVAVAFSINSPARLFDSASRRSANADFLCSRGGETRVAFLPVSLLLRGFGGLFTPTNVSVINLCHKPLI